MCPLKIKSYGCSVKSEYLIVLYIRMDSFMNYVNEEATVYWNNCYVTYSGQHILSDVSKLHLSVNLIFLIWYNDSNFTSTF